MTSEEFEAIVRQTVSDLPPELRRNISNVAIVVEEWPDEDTLDDAEVDNPLDLFGFYHGIPLTERPHNYGLVPPDKISIYRQPITRASQSDSELREAIQRTVRHELAHYFGIDDDRLEELGAY